MSSSPLVSRANVDILDELQLIAAQNLERLEVNKYYEVIRELGKGTYGKVDLVIHKIRGEGAVILSCCFLQKWIRNSQVFFFQKVQKWRWSFWRKRRPSWNHSFGSTASHCTCLLAPSSLTCTALRSRQTSTTSLLRSTLWQETSSISFPHRCQLTAAVLIVSLHRCFWKQDLYKK